MRRSFCSVAALTLFAGAASAQFASQGMDLLSHIDLATFGSASGNSCWGFVHPENSHEYALMGLNNKVAVVDVTNPGTPVIVGSVPHTASLWADIKVHGHHAYVTNEAGGGLQVISLEHVHHGAVTQVTNITANGMQTAHTCAVDNTSGFLYTCGSSVTGSNGGLVAYSLANPANPVQVGMWSGHYVHEAQVVTYTSGPYAGKQVAFCHIENAGLAIVDVTNKGNMVVMGNGTYPGVAYCHQGWLSEDRQYLYINDELDGPGQGVPRALTRIMNVSNLSAPTLAGTFSGAASGSVDHNLYVRGRYIFEANYHSGLRVFDAINPTAPVEVAYLDTYPEDDGNGFDGAWSNYPFFPSGTVIVSDIDRGMFVARLNLNFLTFTFPQGQPERLMPGARTPVVVQVSAPGTPVNPSTVTLHARIDAGAFTPVTMTDLGGGLFTANLPAAPCQSVVSWYVSAQTTSGAPFTSPQFAPGTTHSARAYTNLATVANFDMETAAGWTGGAPGDTATSGAWERGVPESTGAQPGADHTPAPGVNCWITGRTAGVSVGSFDVDGGFTTLLSPVLNMAAAEPSTRIGYWRWYNNNAGSNPASDTFRIDLSNNGGASWSSVEIVGPGAPDNAGGWVYHEYRVADVLPLTAQMRMRFVADDAGAGSIVEAAVDDFSAFAYACGSPCPAIATQPAASTVAPGSNASFTVAATGTGTLSYQWRRNNVALANGGAISGATTPTLTISGVQPGDEGQYDVLITASCGSVLSDAALLTIGGCDSIDFNNDGLFPDNLDLQDFVDVFGGGPCSNDPNCNDIDFNNDGLFPDNADIEAMFRVFGGGAC
jgi:choice-of-anchor B domain-containing protein